MAGSGYEGSFGAQREGSAVMPGVLGATVYVLETQNPKTGSASGGATFLCPKSVFVWGAMREWRF